jgi:two-component system, OmpR family, heavy metal sensor histidine kinase CusS
MALCNAGSAFLILTLISLLLYFGLFAQLKNQNRLYLHDEVNTLERMLRSHAGDRAVFAEINPDQAGDEYVKHFIRLLDKQGRPIAETRRMAEFAPHERFRVPERDGRPGVDTLWRTESGNLLLGTSVWVDLGRSTGEQGILEVALDVTNVQSILEVYRLKIYGVLFLGLLLCVAVSLAIAHRGTRPLREMTDMVRMVTVSSLEERICGENWPTEVARLATAMNRMLDRLQDSFERLYNSARNLSHKVRTPLTIIRGEAEVALSRERSVEELQSVILSSLEENNRLVRLADNILFLAEAETGKFHCLPAEIDAAGELDKILDFYSPAAEEKGVTIAREGGATLLADPALFRKAAAALLSNAITYNKSGGSVTFSLRQGEGGGGELHVADTGCGIPVSEREKVFDRFYRIYATRHMDPHGTGLGLPIAKTIMDLHRGMIDIMSDPPHGTTVTLSFRA